MAVYKKLVTLIAKVIVIFIITTSTAIWKKSINSQATYTREGIEQKIFFFGFGVFSSTISKLFPSGRRCH